MMEEAMSNEFDPFEGLSPDDLNYLQEQRQAFSRQKEVHARFSGDDESRAAAAEAHRRAVMEQHGVAPADMAAPQGAPQPAPPQLGPNGAPALFSVLRAQPEKDETGTSLPPTGEKYAPDWKHMKQQIASHDGIWIVSRHEFPAHVAFILGFFGKDGWEPPPDAQKESFEVIVKNGRVFRTDPE